jgi:hypothetical protein
MSVKGPGFDPQYCLFRNLCSTHVNCHHLTTPSYNHSIAIVELLVGCWGVNHACMSFFDKTAPAAKKATNHDHQGMLKVIQHALMVAKL